RGPADRHVADRDRDFGRLLELEPDLAPGQQALVEELQDSPLAVERAKRHGPGETTRAAPRRRGSATAAVSPPGPEETAWTPPIRPGTGSRALVLTACPIASSAALQAGSKPSRSSSTTSGKSCW